MADTAQQDLLTRLAGKGTDQDDPNAWASLAATEPQHATTRHRESKDEQLQQILQRISSLAGDAGLLKSQPAPEPKPQTLAKTAGEDFVPVEPETFRQAQVSETLTEELILKLLLARGAFCGRDIADQVRLPFKLVDE